MLPRVLRMAATRWSVTRMALMSSGGSRRVRALNKPRKFDCGAGSSEKASDGAFFLAAVPDKTLMASESGCVSPLRRSVPGTEICSRALARDDSPCSCWPSSGLSPKAILTFFFSLSSILTLIYHNLLSAEQGNVG